VGLAVARRLAMTRTGAAAGGSASTIVIERNEASGMETSSRNSEASFYDLLLNNLLLLSPLFTSCFSI
jgi:hypothetical protein